MRTARLLILTLGAALALAPSGARAQNVGFQLNRYEPTPAGEWSFWVDHPWYSDTRYFAAGLTFNYAHNPLVYGTLDSTGSFSKTDSIISNQLLAHVDLAGSFLNRVTISASLPVTLLERGTSTPIAGIAPISGVAAGDPRVGAMIRVAGEPDKSPISLSVGAHVWIPLRKFTDSIPAQASDQDVRVLPKLVLAGYGHHVRWSVTGAYLYRPEARIGVADPAGSTAGSEIQLGASISYADKDRRFAIGPEAVATTLVSPSDRIFKADATSLEVLLGAHYNIGGYVQLGVAGGLGVLRQPGTPDARALLRLAYAPLPKPDRDRDGVLDRDDLCPDTPMGVNPDPERRGCPLLDRDEDGVFDPQDQCIDVPAGKNPDPARPGCPLLDRDSDGIFDRDDQCPDVPAGKNPDPAKPGCPLLDRDGDGVFDRQDQCPDTPAGPNPNPEQPGCPDGDRDSDGVLDHQDQCPDVPAGPKPDAKKPGCPAPDRDHDTVVDVEDACPDVFGAPNSDPKKNGCPGLVEVKNGRIAILKPVFFATNKDVILKESFPVLEAVAEALKATPSIKKLEVEGHTDDRGKADYNTQLSDRRAISVMRWLVEHGIVADRVSARGYGPARPVQTNATAVGRAANRRVDFVITDPPQPKDAKVEEPITAPVVVDKDPSKTKGHKTKGHKAKGHKGAEKKSAP